MLEILQFIFSSFWIWIGFTIMLIIVLYAIAILINQLLQIRTTSAAVIRNEIVKSAFNEIQSDPTTTGYHKLLMAEALIRMSKKCKKLSDSEIKSIIGNVFDVK